MFVAVKFAIEVSYFELSKFEQNTYWHNVCKTLMTQQFSHCRFLVWCPQNECWYGSPTSYWSFTIQSWVNRRRPTQKHFFRSEFIHCCLLCCGGRSREWQSYDIGRQPEKEKCPNTQGQTCWVPATCKKFQPEVFGEAYGDVDSLCHMIIVGLSCYLIFLFVLHELPWSCCSNFEWLLWHCTEGKFKNWLAGPVVAHG